MGVSMQSFVKRIALHKASALVAIGVSVVAIVGVAVAADSTVMKGSARVSGKTKTVVVNATGQTLYTLSGERVGNLKCITTACFADLAAAQGRRQREADEGHRRQRQPVEAPSRQGRLPPGDAQRSSAVPLLGRQQQEGQRQRRGDQELRRDVARRHAVRASGSMCVSGARAARRSAPPSRLPRSGRFARRVRNRPAPGR